MPTSPFDQSNLPKAQAGVVQNLSRGIKAVKQPDPIITDDTNQFLVQTASQVLGLGSAVSGAIKRRQAAGQRAEAAAREQQLKEAELLQRAESNLQFEEVIRPAIEQDIDATTLAIGAFTGDQIAAANIKEAQTVVSQKARRRLAEIELAQSQGRTTEQYARTRAMADIKSLLNAHPEHTEEIIKTARQHKSLALFGSGLIPPKKEKTPEQVGMEKAAQEASFNGISLDTQLDINRNKALAGAQAASLSLQAQQQKLSTSGFLTGASIQTSAILNNAIGSANRQQRTLGQVDTASLIANFQQSMLQAKQKMLVDMSNQGIDVDPGPINSHFDTMTTAGIDMFNRGDYTKFIQKQNDTAVAMAKAEDFRDPFILRLHGRNPNLPMEYTLLMAQYVNRTPEQMRAISSNFRAMETFEQSIPVMQKAIEQIYDGVPPTTGLERDAQAVAVKSILQGTDDPSLLQDTVDPQTGKILVSSGQKQEEKNSLRVTIHRNAVRNIGEPLTFDQYNNDNAINSVLKSSEHEALFKATYANQFALRTTNLTNAILQLQEIPGVDLIVRESPRFGRFLGLDVQEGVEASLLGFNRGDADKIIKDINNLVAITQKATEQGILKPQGDGDVLELILENSNQQAQEIFEQREDQREEQEALLGQVDTPDLIQAVIDDPSEENLQALREANPQVAAELDRELGEEPQVKKE